MMGVCILKMWNARNEAAKLFIITLALFSFYRYTYQWLFSLHGVPRYMNAINNRNYSSDNDNSNNDGE